MRLAELLKTVEESTADSWHKMDAHPLHGWAYGENRGVPYVRPIDHNNLAVFRDDVDITLAWGASDEDDSDLTEPWTKKFADPSARIFYVDLRYRGAPVYEWLFVLVDGARYSIPLPERSAKGGFHVMRTDLKFGDLLFSLSGSAGSFKDLCSVLNHAEIVIK